jgi:membrane protease YdiL (CAAX protease family)
MTPTPPESTAVPSETAEPLGIAFWNWLDAALFAGLALPCLLLSLALSKGLGLLLPRAAWREAVQTLTFQFLWYALWFGVLWLILRMRYGRPFWTSLGWVTRWRRMWTTLFVGPVLALAVAVIGVVLRTPTLDNPLQRLLNDRVSLILVGTFAVTLGPIAEELLFRGFLLPLLTRTFGVVWGVVICNLPFALLHGPQYSWSWQHVVLLFIASTVFCVTRIRTGSTAAAALVHAAYNLTFFSGYVLQRKDLSF